MEQSAGEVAAFDRRGGWWAHVSKAAVAVHTVGAVPFRSVSRPWPGNRRQRSRAGGGRDRARRGRSGVLGVVAYLLFALLSGGGSLGELGTLDQQSVGQGRRAGTGLLGVPHRRRRERAPGLPHRRRRQQRPDVLGRRVPASGKQYRYVDTVFFSGLDADGLRPRDADGRPVLLPGRRAGLHRPRLLRRAADEFGAQGGPFARGVRDRARVRPPRPGPARHARESGATRRAPESKARCAPSSRPTATPASGPRTRSRPAFSSELTQADVSSGLDAAAAVGDDRIQ